MLPVSPVFHTVVTVIHSKCSQPLYFGKQGRVKKRFPDPGLYIFHKTKGKRIKALKWSHSSNPSEGFFLGVCNI